jgi:hypothetical protein
MVNTVTIPMGISISLDHPPGARSRGSPGPFHWSVFECLACFLGIHLKLPPWSTINQELKANTSIETPIDPFGCHRSWQPLDVWTSGKSKQMKTNSPTALL